MMTDRIVGHFRLFWLAAGLALSASTVARGSEPPAGGAPTPHVAQLPEPMPPPPARPEPPRPLPPTPPSILHPEVRDIDLNTALRLAGVQNPQLNIARQRVVEAAALRQLAATFILPTINAGTNYDSHTGNLQQSSGNILSVNRSALYVGAGAYAIAAGTVSIPGVLLTGNLAVGVYGYLASRQVVAQREFATVAIRNQAFLATTLAYCELLRAEGKRAVAMQVRDDARRVARLTAAYAAAGQGRKSDADRAATELAQREADVQAAEGEILVASARLCEVLFLDPSIRLHPTDAWVVPHPIVPDPIPVSQLIALGLLNRPELAERRAAIREAMLVLDGAKVLPFSPNYWLGFSGGGFGGGSNLVRPIFGGFGGRSDLDVVAYWTIQNMGVGNLALINTARARLGVARYQEIAVLDMVRAEVAEAYARTHARYAQIGTTEHAVITATDGFKEDVIRLENTVGLPVELLDSLRLLARARLSYLDAIVDYDEAQFELFVALGQPPADMLARPVPTAGVVPPGQPIPVPPGATAAPAPPAPAPENIRASSTPPVPAVASPSPSRVGR